ncbi:MAG: biotin/lipoyl-containing protein [SAR202 cluster bacterium]|jgi:biotin carboxyl carrier protein|nr:biotin/lipoyl-containing protein [SAR202 cluster bacterium]HJO59991.1 biotin/lipoyl-containing protein [SAR202 cluster bacterium]|tara:strand:+ start:9372 stop:9770 length:399 start_codon:yes stop_codon:yes gene_type:complete
MKIRVEEKWYNIEVDSISSDSAVVLVDGERFEVKLEDVEKTAELTEEISGPVSNSVGMRTDNYKEFKSPMPGTIISILVQTGDDVSQGQDICVLESMKMQQTLKSDMAGTIMGTSVSQGDQILDGDVIFLIR